MSALSYKELPHKDSKTISSACRYMKKEIKLFVGQAEKAESAREILKILDKEW